MDAAALLRDARRRAGVTQRALALRAGVPQPTVSRIERGHHVPRLDTLATLLGACDQEITAVPVRGAGVDRSLIRHWLSLDARERAVRAAAYGRAAERLRAAGAARP